MICHMESFSTLPYIRLMHEWPTYRYPNLKCKVEHRVCNTKHGLCQGPLYWKKIPLQIPTHWHIFSNVSGKVLHTAMQDPTEPSRYASTWIVTHAYFCLLCVCMSFSILVYCIQYNLSQCNVNPADPHRETYRMDMSILQTTDNNTFVCA